MRRVIVFFFVIFSLAFSSNIKSVKEENNKIVITMDKFEKNQYQISYDTYNRLIFLEFPKVPLNTNITDENFRSSFVENFQTVNYGDGVGFFIKLKKNVSYKVNTDSNSLELVFNSKSGKKEYTIIIDPGHGGKDSGAVGFNKYYEKNVVLAVSKYLRDELGDDFNVIMTRSTDVFVTLGERPRIGNRAKADMFISIHANSALTNTMSGVEVFYFSKKSSPYAERIAAFENSVGDKYGEKTDKIVQIMGELAYKKNQEISIGFAKKIAANFASNLNMKNKGVHGANFAVLRGFNGPGVLVELGFINNSNDIKKLLNSDTQREMARSIAEIVRQKYY